MKIQELEKGLEKILKKEKCKYGYVTIDHFDLKTIEMRVRANGYLDKRKITGVLLKYHPTAAIEWDYENVIAILSI